MTVTAVFYVLTIVLLCGNVVSFSGGGGWDGRRGVSADGSAARLNLCPGQGDQLVAAFNANCCSSSASSATTPSNEGDDSASGGALSLSKKFLNRVFHIPSVPHPIIDKVQQQDQQQENHFHFRNILRRSNSNTDTDEDVVMYPIVGFRFVTDHTSSSDVVTTTVVPTKSHPSCRLKTCLEKQEAVFGWYSPACKLDVFSEDVCRNPIETSMSNNLGSSTITP